MKHFVFVGLFLGAISLSCGAQQLSNTALNSGSHAVFINADLLKQLQNVEYPELTFQPGDVLTVMVYGFEKDFALNQRVEEDGSILFPLIGKTQVAGLTVQKLELALEDALTKSGMLENPQVTVQVVAQPSARVTVSGDVTRPGVFPAAGHLTILDYISQAGGFIDTLTNPATVNAPASFVVTLVRPSFKDTIRIPLGPDPQNAVYGQIPILPGDQILVGKTGYVYAFGAFKLQGVFPMKNTGPTTVLQLASQAGGIGFEGDRKDAHIVRTNGNSKYIVDVNVQKILEGKQADVALQPEDILFVPTNNMRAAIKGGGSGLIVSLASAYIYTHP